MSLIEKYKKQLDFKGIKLKDEEIKEIVEAQKIVAKIVFEIWKNERQQKTIDKK